jgi:hypothetical protein
LDGSVVQPLQLSCQPKYTQQLWFTVSRVTASSVVHRMLPLTSYPVMNWPGGQIWAQIPFSHGARWQSASTTHDRPGGHAGHALPPQSTAVSLPFLSPSLHVVIWQTPPVHVPPHAAPHAPQFPRLVFVLVSQPLPAFASQSPVPAAHDEHAPPEHVWFVAQTAVAHVVPQLESRVSGFSHPFG